jgi:SAM-dependent methyltransferase
MNRAYWDRLARRYSDEVLEITAIDSSGLLARTAAEIGRRSAVAGDFGCGVGSTTRAFAPYFERTVGIDFAPKLLAEARRRTRDATVSYVLADLAADEPLGFRVDAGFCVSCLIAPRYATRMRIARSVVRAVRRGGPIVIVVPSLESALRTYHALVRLDIAEGDERRDGLRRVNAIAAREVRSIADGIVTTGGAPTKHYLGDEIVEFAAEAGLRVERLERVEYPWRDEIELGRGGARTRAALGKGAPWDWLVVARSRG